MHAPLIEVVAGLLNVLSSTIKGRLTKGALYTGKNVYSTYVTLFRDTMSKAWEFFAPVPEMAQKTRRVLGIVLVPLTADLGADQSETQRGPQSVRNRVLCSVLEGIKAPTHLGTLVRGDGQILSKRSPWSGTVPATFKKVIEDQGKE